MANQWIKSVDDLSVRAQNIIQRLGGIDYAIEHFRKCKTFLDIRNAGKSTNEELIELCQYLEDKASNEPERNLDEQKHNWNVGSTIELMQNFYQFLKEELSPRSLHVIVYLERAENFYLGEENALRFLNKYLISDFDFRSLRNIGKKAEKELNEFRNQFIIKIENISTNSANEYLNKQKLVRFLGKAISENDFRNLYGMDEKYNFILMSSLHIQSVNIKTGLSETIKNEFFTFDSLSRKELSLIINKSSERIRQLLIKIPNVISQAINKMINHFGENNWDFNQYRDKNIIEFHEIIQFEFQNVKYVLNKKFISLIYECALQNSHISIDKLIENYLPSKLALQQSRKPLFVSTAFVEITRLPKLLQFIDVEIYEFEKVQFDFNQIVLIERFYNERDISISDDTLTVLNRIVELVKSEDIKIDKVELKKLQKRTLHSYVLDLIHKQLEERNKPLSTNVILQNLAEVHIPLNKPYLFKILKSTADISRVGHGMWALSDWPESQKFKGSIRDTVVELLLKSSEPLHVSELIDLLSPMRIITEHSLTTNLKTDELKRFQFLGCSFIGLTGKKYTMEWITLPKFRYSLLRSAIHRVHRPKSNDEWILILSAETSYPMKHIRYILRNNKLL